MVVKLMFWPIHHQGSSLFILRHQAMVIHGRRGKSDF